MKWTRTNIVILVCVIALPIALLYKKYGIYPYRLHERSKQALTTEVARLPFSNKLETKEYSLFKQNYCEYSSKVRAFRCDMFTSSVFGTDQEVLAAASRINDTMVSLGWEPGARIPYSEDRSRKDLARGILPGYGYSKHVDGIYLTANFAMAGPEKNLPDYQQKRYEPYRNRFGHVFTVTIDADMVDSY